MLRPRVIPILLIRNKGLYKTVNFRRPVYIGDPINAIKIFNEKEVDELIILDISDKSSDPEFDFISHLAGECFMPLCYGGKIKSLEDIRRLNELGVEKVSLNTIAAANPEFVKEAANEFGSSTIVVSMDVKKDFWGKSFVYSANGKTKTKYHAAEYATLMQEMGAGEILLTNIDREGTYQGFDLSLVESVSSRLTVPLIACGGASGLNDFKLALEKGASAVAAGSYFVYYGTNRAVLINYPSDDDIRALRS